MNCTKIKYNSQDGALKAAKNQVEKLGIHLRAYLCFNCMHWHLTSMNANEYLKNKKSNAKQNKIQRKKDNKRKKNSGN